MDINHICNQVKQIAQSVGKYLIEEQQKLQTNDIELKSTRNYVTYIDKEAERQLVEKLQKLLPSAGFLTEEETVACEQKEWMWIIDPLDGTTNFVHGDTPFSVSIALMRNNEAVLGVVFDPVAKELYYSTENGKAYLNDKPIQVSSHPALENAFIGYGIPYSLDDNGERIVQNAVQQFRRCSFRMKGSAAIELCYVACGRYDAYFHSGLSPWDVAAATFILQCAGGQCTDFSATENFVFGRELVATNGLFHSELMDKIILPRE